MRKRFLSTGWMALGWLVAAGFGAWSVASPPRQEWKSGIVWPEPKVVDPGPPGGPPADAVVLFDGKDLSRWQGGENWKIEDGVAVSQKNGITTKDAFGDCQLHLEFATPAEVQGRGNSGVYLM